MNRFAIALLAVGCLVLTACDSPGASGPTARVVSVVDGDTLVVELEGKQERVRLIGVDTPEIGGRRGGAPEFYAREATEYTTSLADGVAVTLAADPQTTDRDAYDRLLRYVYLPDGRLLNAAIIADGYGHAFTRFPFSKLDEFRRLERDARTGGVGLWHPDVIPKIPLADLHNHMGETVVTCGPVGSSRYVARENGAPTFVNLGRAYPDQTLTVVIWGTDRETFGTPEASYRDRSVCVLGKLETFRGKPQIEIRDPDQISVEE